MNQSEKIFFDIIYYICMITGLYILIKYSNVQIAIGVLLVTLAIKFMNYKDLRGK